MGNRTIERAIARRLYGEFSKAWRSEKRLAGKYGERGYRKPTFSQWYGMHQHDQEMMRQSSPQDVQEYLGLQDPWAEEMPKAPQESSELKEERGVMTIPIAGDEE